MPKTKSSTKAKAAKPAARSSATKAAPVRTTVTRTTVTNPGKNAFSRRLTGELSLGALFAELIGTFVLTVLLLNTSGNAIIAGVTVLVFTIILGRLSGGHLNPAITIGLLATRQITWVRAAGYIVAQLLGAMLALVVVSLFINSTPDVQIMNPYTSEPTIAEKPTLFKVDGLNGDWRPFFAEALGALVLGLGVAAARFTRREGMEAGFAIGGALMLGLLVATYQGTTAVLNPAVALGLDAYKMDNFGWALGVYAIAPIVGVAAGAWLFRLLQLDNQSAKKEEAEAA